MSVFISTDLILSESSLYQPLTHARIGYDNIITYTNLSGTAGESGFPLTAMSHQATYERYKPISLPATVDIDAGAPVSVDYVGIAAHTLGTSGTTVTIYYSLDDVSYTEVSAFNPGTDQTIMALFDAVTARYWRIVFSGATVPTVGVVYVGLSLAMQRMIYGGHSPLTLSRISAVRPSVSETGQWLGSSQERKGFKTQFSWKNLTAAWYRANFDPFAATNPKATPFFIAWRPLTYPQEVGYCWATQDISPTNQGTKDFMEVSMSVEAFNDRD